MIRFILGKLCPLAAVAAVFFSIGSIGMYLDWTNPFMEKIGFRQSEVRERLRKFPKENCGEELRPICTKVANGVGWFLGV